MRTTQKSYDDAMNKLKTGRGNLINRAQEIKELGARTNKQLPSS
jgi:DNA recombination protein RmuC